jgi:hypothetical protein
METGKIALINTAGKPASVEAELVNNNLWLCKREIAKIFNCYPQKIEMNLRSIFQKGLLCEKEVTYLRRYIYKETECQCIYYNMDVLIFLSYRIGTREAKIFREFINDSFREHVRNKNKPKTSKILWIAPPCFN